MKPLDYFFLCVNVALIIFLLSVTITELLTNDRHIVSSHAPVPTVMSPEPQQEPRIPGDDIHMPVIRFRVVNEADPLNPSSCYVMNAEHTKAGEYAPDDSLDELGATTINWRLVREIDIEPLELKTERNQHND